MSSFERRQIMRLLAALPLAGCGFTPVYGPGGAARGLIGQIRIEEPTDRNGFDLNGRLQERLGRAKSARWQLSYRIKTEQVGLAVTTSNITTRYNLLGSVSYSLTRSADGGLVKAGKVESFTSYSASGTVVSTAASERDANARLMRILADQIVTDLVASAGDWVEP
ncbi:MAG: LPS assembly lipoprotein LptE [Paracoccaceae bacterium]